MERPLKLPINYSKADIKTKRAAREEYAKRQHGLCLVCKEPLCDSPSKEILEFKINEKLFPKEFFKHAVHLHHDHKTGMTIGTVHSKCNAYLWQHKGE